MSCKIKAMAASSLCRSIALIFAIALVTRGLVALPAFDHFEIGGAYTLDSPRYERLALTLLKEGVYEAHPYTRYKGLERELYAGPEVYRTPGYPLFLAGIFALTGYSTTAVLIIQIVLAALSCVLIYLIGRSLYDHRTGVWAAILAIVNIKLGVYAGQVMSETLFTFLLVTCFYAATAFFEKPVLSRSLLCATGFIFLAITRPTGMHMALIFAVVAIACLRSWQPVAWASMAALAAVLVIQLLAFRNYQKLDVWAATSNDSITIGLYFPSAIWAASHGLPYRDGELEVLRRLAQQSPEFEAIYRGAQADKDELYVWRHDNVHDLKFAVAVRPVGIAILLEEWRMTLSKVITGGLWSLFSGLGEWRNWIISPADYDKLKKLIPAAKQAVARLDPGPATRGIKSILAAVPIGALAVFVFVALYNVVVVAGAVVGVWHRIFARVAGSGFRRAGVFSPSAASGWLIALWFAYVIATVGPTANARYLAPILPLVCVPAAAWVRERRLSRA